MGLEVQVNNADELCRLMCDNQLPKGKLKECPRCGKMYSGYPAISRTDNKTEICSQCGTAEAMEEFLTGSICPIQ